MNQETFVLLHFKIKRVQSFVVIGPVTWVIYAKFIIGFSVKKAVYWLELV